MIYIKKILNNMMSFLSGLCECLNVLIYVMLNRFAQRLYLNITLQTKALWFTKYLRLSITTVENTFILWNHSTSK